MQSEQLKRMASMSGDSGLGKPPKYVVPLIRFNGNRGEYRKISYDADGNKVETPLTNPVQFVILKKRRLLSHYSPNGSYFTNEYDSPNQQVSLFKNVAGTVTHEATGIATDLREQFQQLRTHEVIYLLHEGQVCKMEVKGGSLGNYYDYQKSLQDEDLHGFQVLTSVSSESAKSEGGMSYYKITFQKLVLTTSLDEVEAHMTEVSSNLKKLDDYFAAKSRSNSPANVAHLDKVMDDMTAPTEKTIQLDEEPNPDDIPF